MSGSKSGSSGKGSKNEKRPKPPIGWYNETDEHDEEPRRNRYSHDSDSDYNPEGKELTVSQERRHKRWEHIQELRRENDRLRLICEYVLNQNQVLLAQVKDMRDYMGRAVPMIEAMEADAAGM